jgi:murein peptide amidase A
MRIGTGYVAPMVAAPPHAPPEAHAAAAVVGHSVRGRPIVVRRVGAASAPRKLLVIGEIHGNELAGRPVVRALRRARPPKGLQLLLVDDVNPDGAAAGTRQNAHGVDLNRNFGVGWRRNGFPFSTYFPGSKPFSEPESRALAALVKRERPQATITYHQHMDLVDGGDGKPALTHLYAGRSGLPWRTLGRLPGTATRWQNRRFPGGSAFVVELPAGRLSAASVSRHERAVLAVARALARQPASSAAGSI